MDVEGPSRRDSPLSAVVGWPSSEKISSVATTIGPIVLKRRPRSPAAQAKLLVPSGRCRVAGNRAREPAAATAPVKPGEPETSSTHEWPSWCSGPAVQPPTAPVRRCPTPRHCPANGRLVANDPRAKKLAKQLRPWPLEIFARQRPPWPHPGRGRVEAGPAPAAERAPGIGRQQFLRTLPPRCAARQRSSAAGAAARQTSGPGLRSPAETVAFNNLSRQSSATVAASLTVPLPRRATRTPPIASMLLHSK